MKDLPASHGKFWAKTSNGFLEALEAMMEEEKVVMALSASD